MAKTITLKFPGKCKDCGAALEVGAVARWYGRGRVYGTTCHEQRPTKRGARATAATGPRCGDCGKRGETTGHQTCEYPGAGFVGFSEARAVAASRQTGPCEDAPCCGCCGPGTGGYGDYTQPERDEMDGARMGGFGREGY